MIHSYKGFFFRFLLLTSLRATLGVPELPIIMLISSTHSHIKGTCLVDFTNFSAPFVMTLFGGVHIEVIFGNESSQTLYFNVIFSSMLSCENFFNNAPTSFVRVGSPQESSVSFVPLMDNIFQCTWMDDKGIELLIWLYLASSWAHGRPWVVLSVQSQTELSIPIVAGRFNSSKIKLCACVKTKPCSLL